MSTESSSSSRYCCCYDRCSSNSDNAWERLIRKEQHSQPSQQHSQSQSSQQSQSRKLHIQKSCWLLILLMMICIHSLMFRLPDIQRHASSVEQYIYDQQPLVQSADSSSSSAMSISSITSMSQQQLLLATTTTSGTTNGTTTIGSDDYNHNNNNNKVNIVPPISELTRSYERDGTFLF